jgi:hypothetical protein
VDGKAAHGGLLDGIVVAHRNTDRVNLPQKSETIENNGGIEDERTLRALDRLLANAGGSAASQARIDVLAVEFSRSREGYTRVKSNARRLTV